MGGKAIIRIIKLWLQDEQIRSDCASSAMCNDFIEILNQDVARGSVHCHAAPAFGFACGALGLPKTVMLDAFAYTFVRDSISAAVRLDLIGPLRAVTLQSHFAAEIAAMAHTMPCTIDSAANTAPLIDAVHGCHDLLEMRLFRT